MDNNHKLLSSILETAQMGQIGIRAALKADMQHPLRLGLQSQLKEYDKLEGDANRIAAAKGWKMHDIDPAVKFMAKATSKGKLTFGDVNSKIAAMMIQGNTRGMILTYKNMNRCQNPDSQVFALAQKMLDSEENNIRQMQPYL